MTKIISKNIKTHTIDADGKTIGRLATKIAVILMGKHVVGYAPNIAGSEVVEVVNLNRATFTGKKFEQKEYFHFSGYPGGLKTRTLDELWTTNPGFVLKNAVLHMLPNNKLRKERIKRLIIK